MNLTVSICLEVNNEIDAGSKKNALNEIIIKYIKKYSQNQKNIHTEIVIEPEGIPTHNHAGQ